jgi:hypothetical protein
MFAACMDAVTVDSCLAVVGSRGFMAEVVERLRVCRKNLLQCLVVSRHGGSAQLRLVLTLEIKMSRISDSAHIKVWTLDHMPFHCVLPTDRSST